MARKLTPTQRRRFRKEAEEWDLLSDEDIARLMEEWEEVPIHFRRPQPKTLTVALDSNTLNRLKRVARRKQVAPRQLAAMWISERLSKEPTSATGQHR